MLATVIIPALNEARNIDRLLKHVLDVIEGSGLGADVLVVDGGSTDGTVEAVEEWAKTKPVRLLRSDGERGVPGDVLYAAGRTEADIVAVMDADLGHPPESLPELLRPVMDGSCDMVIGSRYISGGSQSGWSWHRRLLSRTAACLAWPLVSVRDPMSGFFAVKRPLLLDYGQGPHGDSLGLEIMARSGDTLKVREVPVRFPDRQKGRPKPGSGVFRITLEQIVRLAGGLDAKGNAAGIAWGTLVSVLADAGVFTVVRTFGWGTGISQAAGFTAAALSVFLLIVRKMQPQEGNGPGARGPFFVVRYLTILFLALFLRTGVIATLLLSPRVPVALAFAAGVASAAAVLCIGILFFLSPGTDEGTGPGIRWRVLGVAAAAYSLALRVFYAGIMELIPEEAYYWNYGQHLDLSYLDHPPVVGWLNHISTGIFGNHEMAVRLPAILCWCLTVFFLYRLTKGFYNKTAALIAVLMVSVLPIYLGTGLFMMPDPPLYAAWAGALYYLSRALVDQRHRAWLGVGVCLGLGMISKYTIVLLAAATLVFVLIHIREWTRRTLLRPELYLGAVLSILLFSPVILWNARHGWASFAFQGARRWSGLSDFSLHILVINILILITPVGAVAVFRALFPGRGRLRTILGEMDPQGLKLSFCRVYTFTPLAVFVVHSFTGLSKFNWTGPVWLAAFPLLGGILSGLPGARAGGGSGAGSFSPGIWRWIAAACFLLFGGLLFFIKVGMPGATPIRGMIFPLAWHEMARQIDAVPMRENRNGKPLVVGLEDYWIASEYSFYRGPQRVKEPAGRHLVGNNSLMWSYWLAPEEAAGRDVILVALKREKVEEGRLEKYFDTMGETVELRLQKEGRVVAFIYYRAGFSYRPGS